MAVESADSHDAQADKQAGGSGGSSGGRGSQPQPGVGGSLPARHPDSMLLGACWQRARKAAEAQPPRMPGMCTCRKAATGTRSGFAIHTLGLRLGWRREQWPKGDKPSHACAACWYAHRVQIGCQSAAASVLRKRWMWARGIKQRQGHPSAHGEPARPPASALDIQRCSLLINAMLFSGLQQLSCHSTGRAGQPRSPLL